MVIARADSLPPEQELVERLGAAWQHIEKLVASDAEPDDNFGYSLALSGNSVISGARQNNAPSNNSGAAYVFERNPGTRTWTEVIKLRPDDGDTGDEFGRAVAIDGDWLVVRTQWDDDAGNDRGAAYTFQRTPGGAGAWTRVAKLNADDAAFRDFFGRTVAISGNRVVVGAPEDDDLANGGNSGSAYVFECDLRNGAWNQIDKLTAADREPNDMFGSAVAIAGDTVMIGSSEHSPAGVNNAGAVYVFRGDAGSNIWNQVEKITAADGDEADEFGFSVALIEGRALIGAPADDDAENVGGSAYIFERIVGPDTWRQTDKLTADDSALGDDFGYSAALAGERALVGARWDDDKGDESGSAYLFQRNAGNNTWIQIGKLTAADSATEDWFGFAVSLSEELALIGAYQAADESGSAYLFRHNDLIVTDNIGG